MNTFEYTAHMRAALGLDDPARKDPALAFHKQLFDKMDAEQRARDKAFADGMVVRKSDATDSDRRAAVLINEIMANISGSLVGSPAYATLKTCDSHDTGALIAGISALAHDPGWAGAIGIDRAYNGFVAETSGLALLVVLLRRKYCLSAAQHRSLLIGMTKRYKDMKGGFDQLENRVVEWAAANPGVNRVELQALFKAVGGNGSLMELAIKLQPLMRYRPSSEPMFVDAPTPPPTQVVPWSEAVWEVSEYGLQLASDMQAAATQREEGIAAGRSVDANPWTENITQSDRTAAALINAFFERFNKCDIPWDKVSAYRKMKALAASDRGAVVTGLFSMSSLPGWAAAIGVDDDAMTLEETWLTSVLNGVLGEQVTLTPSQHRVLLLALIEHCKVGNYSQPKVEDLVLKWIEANPGVNTPELRELFAVANCRGSLADLADKLRNRAPKVIRTLAEAAALLRHHKDELQQDSSIGLHPGGYWIDHNRIDDGTVRSTLSLRFPVSADSKDMQRLLDADPANMPTAGELMWLLFHIGNLPTSDCSAALVHVVTRLLIAMKVPTSAPVFVQWQAIADQYAKWELGKIVASVRGLMALEDAMIAQWPAEGKALLAHLETATGSKPTARWLKELNRLAPLPMRAELATSIRTALDTAYFDRRLPIGFEARVKGVVWSASICDPALVCPALTRFAMSFCYQSVPGHGMRDEALGNTCVTVLASLPNGTGIPYLMRLLAKVRYPKVKKLIEAALNDAAAKAGITRAELDEISVPTHDLVGGRLEMPVGAGAALLAIECTALVALSWRTPDGKVTKGLPAALKGAKDEIKAVKARVKEIEADLAIQPWRLQRLWLDDRRWTVEAWRKHYAEHPLMGALTGRLIWNAHAACGIRTAGVWQNGTLAGLDGQPVSLEGAEISLWHPVGCEVAEVVSWRERLAALGIVQPFKQAYREVYIVTDAERRTGIYSNRFAGHIIKQHQMQALARLNGWSMTVHVGYDGGMGKYPSRIALPKAGLVAEYWLEGTGGDNDYTPNGANLYLATDQVRFVRPTDMVASTKALGRNYDAIEGEVVRIEDVPPLVLSEIMRHCDLFVGVASIANDPNWVDAGTDVVRGHWREAADRYWQDRSFGDVGAQGEMRRGLLMALLPSLAIGKVCRIEGRFLRVRGTVREYKIHLGSGNIQMEPNDQYLCIVPKNEVQHAKTSVRLPFEGDTILSIILSKAALLAADDKITDPTILSQIRQ